MTLVISAGYAAEFSVWGQVERFISYPERMLTACFLMTSLLVFVGWQVRGLWVMSQQQLAIVEIVSSAPADFFAVVERFRVNQAKARASLLRQMPVVLGITIAFAALAGVILIIVCLDHLTKGHR
jgi:hypothetical protein